MVTVKNSFRDEYSFLSNFYPSPVTYRGVVFPTAEHAEIPGDNALGVMLMTLRLHLGIQQPPPPNS